MNIRTLIKLIVLATLVYSCHAPTSTATHKKFKLELFAVEKEFCADGQWRFVWD